MVITTIRYRRVVNLGNYQSQALEAEATVDEDENPTTAYFKLRTWVRNQLDVDGQPTK